MRQNYLDNQVLVNPVLAISAGSSPLAKTTNAFNFTVGGSVFTKAAGNLPALTTAGTTTVPAGSQIIYSVYIDNLGNYTLKQGNITTVTAGVTSVDLPTQPTVTVTNNVNTVNGYTFVGLIHVVNATNPFIPGTTALDAAGVTVYYSNNFILGL